MQSPLLSIITPTYNLLASGREMFFRQCVETVRKQSCQLNLEHIIVDSCSRDGTSDLISSFPLSDQYRIVSKKDHSIYEGINNGLMEARGKYILCLNSDDYLTEDDALYDAINTLEVAGADYLYGDVNVVTIDGRLMRVWRGSMSGLPFAQHYCHQSMIVKRDVLNAIKGFDLQYKISADSDVMLRLYHDSYSAVYSSRVFSNFRAGGVSGENTETARNDHAKAFYNYFGKEAGLSISDCVALWCYNGIGSLSYADALRILIALPEQTWRMEWWRKMCDGYDGKMLAVNKKSLVYRLRSKVRQFLRGEEK